MKSYFCQTCGRSYNQKELLQDGHRLHCVHCPKGKIVISGWPMLFIGLLLGMMVLFFDKFQTHGQLWYFSFLGLAMAIAGILRIFQADAIRKRVAKQDAQNPEELPEAPLPMESADVANDSAEKISTTAEQAQPATMDSPS